MRFRSFAVIAALVAPMAAFAQATDSLDLQGRSTIFIGIGLTGTRDASSTINGASTHASGEVGSVGFRHFVTSQTAVEISAALLSADASSAGGHSQANAVTPILFGLRVAPRAIAIGPSLRPFVSAAAGAYIHSMTDAFLGGASDRTETAPGARLAAGADWLVGRHFVMSFEGNYNAVGSFEHPDAVTDRVSGFGMMLGFGVAWGGR